MGSDGLKVGQVKVTLETLSTCRTATLTVTSESGLSVTSHLFTRDQDPLPCRKGPDRPGQFPGQDLCVDMGGAEWAETLGVGPRGSVRP